MSSNSALSTAGKGKQFAVVVVSTVVAIAYLFLRQKQQRERHSKSSKNGDGNNRTTTKELLDDFNFCCKKSRLLSGICQSTQLELYAYYKQATVGPADASTAPRPSPFDLVASTKYSAWKALRDKSSHAAMEHYVKLVHRLIKTFRKEGRTTSMSSSVSTVDDEEGFDCDDFVDAVGEHGLLSQTFGAGVASTLMNEDEDEEDDDDDFPLNEKALHIAARDNNPTRLEELLTTLSTTSNENENPINPNFADKSSQTALHLAADRGHIECCAVLLKHGANPLAADGDLISVLQTAVIASNVDICRLLLENGADPDQPDMDGDTPRTCAQDDGNQDMKDLFEAKEKSAENSEGEESEVLLQPTMSQARQMLATIDSLSLSLDEEDADLF
jgi:acyl-CoA-binding protein